MGEEQLDRWDAGVEDAWTAFRGRLADAVASIGDDGVIEVELESRLDDEEQHGAAPYVQFIGWSGDLVRAEAASNAYLDVSFALELGAYDEMFELGWGVPTYGEDEEPDEGSANFWLDVEAREADRVAWMAVRALREVFGCVHPSFLVVSGLEEQRNVPEPHAEVAVPEEPIAFAQTPEELHELVVRAVGVLLDEQEVKVDDEGDIPIRVGTSVVFVRVLGDRPVVDVFAEIVIAPQDVERLALEVGILNRAHRFAKFFFAEERVVMTHRLLAVPFLPSQLRAVINAFTDDVEEIAATLVARVGGHRFLERLTTPVEPVEPVGEDCPPMVGLLELMLGGRVSAGTVVELFEHDRREIVRMIVAIRQGSPDCGDLDEDDVLDHLRRALDLVARQEARATRAASRLAAGGSTQELSLLDADTVHQAHRRRPRTA